MKLTLLEVVLVLAMVIASAAAGAQWMKERNAKALQTAHDDTQTCLDSNRSIQDALDRMQQLIDVQKAQLAAQRAALVEAMKQRDAAIAALPKATEARIRALEKTAHESPSCQSLATLPVCPAVGERLWGDVARGDTATSY